MWCGPNSLEVLATIHAARKLGLVAVPLSYRFTAEEMAYVIDNSDATTVVVDAEQAPLVAEVRAEIPKVRTVVVFGGAAPDGLHARGTTCCAGQPDTEPDGARRRVGGGRGDDLHVGHDRQAEGRAAHAHRPRARVRAARRARTCCTSNAVHLTTGPLYHSGPLAFASLVAHARRADRRAAQVRRARAWIELVKEHRVTNTFSAPTQLKRIVSLPDDVLAQADLSSMVTLIANAAPVPYALKQEIIAKLGDGFLYEVYGSTELGVDTVLKPEDQLRKPGSCGKPYGGIEIKIVDGRRHRSPAPSEPGELFVRTDARDGRLPPHRASSSPSSTTASGSRSATSRTSTTRATSTSATARRT